MSVFLVAIGCTLVASVAPTPSATGGALGRAQQPQPGGKHAPGVQGLPLGQLGRGPREVGIHSFPKQL